MSRAPKAPTDQEVQEAVSLARQAFRHMVVEHKGVLRSTAAPYFLYGIVAEVGRLAGMNAPDEALYFEERLLCGYVRSGVRVGAFEMRIEGPVEDDGSPTPPRADLVPPPGWGEIRQ